MSGWISCKERLPSESGEYWVVVEFPRGEWQIVSESRTERVQRRELEREVFISTYADGKWGCVWNMKNEVLAWMKMPAYSEIV